MRNLFLLPFLMALVVSCAKSPDDTIAPTDQRFTLERTVCFGFCPIYQATVYADGRLVFTGERYTQETGEHEKQMPDGTFERLVKIAEDHDFASFDARYPNEKGDNCGPVATDMPSVNIAVKSAPLSHAVSLYQGCFEFDGRERFDAMVAEIDEVLALDDWVGEREQFYGSGK